MKGLPKIDEFAKWAKDGGKPVKVFGVNTMEEAEGAERVSKIGEFWKKKAFSFATLIDDKNATSGAYGVQGIPFTVVIDPKGNVADVHQVLSPTLVDDLKRATDAALASPKG
jgi:peroxiredoxin